MIEVSVNQRRFFPMYHVSCHVLLVVASEMKTYLSIKDLAYKYTCLPSQLKF